MLKANSRITRLVIIAALALNLTGCSNMDENQQRMVSGGAVGVVAGALTTVVTGGCIACGMAIGGAVGTAGGYAIGKIDNETRSSPSSGQAAYNNSYNNPNAGIPQGYPASGSY